MTLSFDNKDLEPFLGSVSLFQGLPPEILKEATQRLKLRQHPPDKLLLIEEDWGNSVYLIVEGWVKIRTYNYDGKEVTLNILGPGDTFGEMALLLSSPRSTDVLSLTAVLIGSLPADDFLNLVNSSHLVGLNLAKMMAKRLQQLNRRLRMREADSVARVVDILLFLAEGQGKSSAMGVEIPMLTHQEIASLSGLSRETVTRAMSKLEKKGVIQRSNRDSIYVPNLPALEKLLC
jgi:CRP/FNR family transcriptional regulator, cyclic AMP receptor protein